MAAPKGNKNAEKWTFEDAQQLFVDAIELTHQKETYFLKQGEKAIEVKGYSFDFIGEIARELKTFKDIFNHLVKRFPELQHLKNQLDSNIESNCYWNTKKGNIREATGIVNLKSNWKWTDRNDHSSHDGTMTPKTSIITTLSEDELKQLIKK